MSLLRYSIDLNGVSEEERERILKIIELYAETGPKPTGKRSVFTFFLDESDDVKKVPGLPASLIHQTP